MKWVRVAILAMCSLVGFLLLGSPLWGRNAEALTLSKIEEAWKGRESRVSGLSIDWKETRHIPRGARSEKLKKFREVIQKLNNPKGEIIPPNDVQMEFVSSFQFDGKRVRYTTAHPSWSLAKESYVLIPTQTVSGPESDEKLSRDPATLEPTGFINSPGKLFVRSTHQLRPVWYTIRGCAVPWRMADLKKQALTSRKLLIGDAWGIELEERLPRSDVVFRRWVDPQRGFVVLRESTIQRGVVITQVDIQYERDSIVGWMPKSWVVISNQAKGRTLETSRSAVMGYTINPKLRDADFTLRFPPGTKVRNLMKNEKYAVPGVPDSTGSPQLLPPDHSPAHPTAAQASITDNRSFTRPLLGSGLAFTVFCMSVYIVCYLARKRKEVT